MTLTHQTRDSEALDEIERRLSKQGYTLLRSPAPEVAPAFMGGFRPDAIATGRSPNLLIEVIARRGSGDAALARIDEAKRLLEGHADWRLEVVYDPSSTPEPSVVPASAIRHRLDEINRLARTDGRAALILTWSILEAVARALRPDRAARALTPGSTIELLASLGYITRAEADTLREAVHARNLIVHGDLTATVSRAALATILDIADRLVSLLEVETAR